MAIDLDKMYSEMDEGSMDKRTETLRKFAVKREREENGDEPGGSSPSPEIVPPSSEN